MPRKSTRRDAAGEEGIPARRTRSRKQAEPAAVPPAESTSVPGAPVESSAPAVRAMAAAAGANGASTPGEVVLDRREIEQLAYYYWLERGGQGGSAEEDWFRAEQELRRRRGLLPKQA